MKNLRWLFFVLMVSPGCSDFYHLHYRKLNKVPASGENASVAVPEKIRNQKGAVCKNDFSENKKTITLDSVIQKKDVAPVETKIKVKINSNSPASLSPKHLSQKTFLKRFLPQKSHHPNDHRFLIILGLLFLGLLLLSWGIGVIITGFVAASIWIIFGGLGLVFLGLLPFAGLFSMIVGDKAKTDKQFEEKHR